MFETVAWISIIIGFVVVIAFSLTAMLLTRRREQEAPKPVGHDEAVAKVDAAADAALNEINKTAGMILADINEKYQTLLFLYDLMDEKKKGLAPPPAAFIQPEMAAVKIPAAPPGPPKREKKPSVLNAKYEKIIVMYNEGMQLFDIAKELDMGKGEVKLILDLAERGAL